MANTAMAILQEIDKCMKCRACQVACQRVQGLGTTVGNAETVQFDDPTVVKAQKANDSPPFVRYSCWHCNAPACAYACPVPGAIKTASTGAVYVDRAVCNPADSRCSSARKPCVTKCHRGGYPKVATVNPGPGLKAYKCDMCNGRTEGPACAATCPAKALTYDTMANINAKLNDPLNAAKYKYKVGDGHMFWASSKPFKPPTTDPYIEDHISPMLGRLMNSPVSKTLVLPTLLFGGVYALYRRRLELAGEPKEA